jgi:hypothetical protein
LSKLGGSAVVQEEASAACLASVSSIAPKKIANSKRMFEGVEIVQLFLWQIERTR